MPEDGTAADAESWARVSSMVATMTHEKIPVEQICGTLHISRATYFRYLKAARGVTQSALCPFVCAVLMSLDF